MTRRRRTKQRQLQAAHELTLQGAELMHGDLLREESLQGAGLGAAVRLALARSRDPEKANERLVRKLRNIADRRR